MSGRFVTAATGRPPGDHLCWPFHGAEDLTDTALAYVAEGLARRERVACLDIGERGTFAGVLAEVPTARDAQPDQVLMVPLTMLPGFGPEVDPTETLIALEQMTLAALVDGYAGLRVIADATAQAADPQLRGPLVGYEHLVDRFSLTHSLTALCCYDADVLGEPVVAELASVHAFTRGAPSPFLLRALRGRGCVALSGEVDSDSAELLHDALRRVWPRGDRTLVVDVTDLEFADHAGILAAERAARSMDGVITLVGAPEMVTWLVAALGVERLTCAVAR